MTELPLADRSVELVRAWVDSQRPRGRRPDAAGRRLAALLKDPHGLDFTIGLIDRVIRPEDHRVAARNLRSLSRELPAFLAFGQRLVFRFGAVVALMLPGLAVTLAQRTVRRMVSHLVVDAHPDELTRSVRRLRRGGDRLNLSPIGDAVLGDAGAARRRDETLALLERDDVDQVSVNVSAVASNLTWWAFDDSVDRLVSHLTPLFASAGPTKLINLDFEEYQDLQLTIAVFTRLMDQFPEQEAGIVLQACLPDSLDAMKSLHAWASRRRTAGGAPIRTRVVKGTDLALEHVDATLRGWPLATWSSTQETDTHYKRLLHWAFRPERADAVRIGVAGQNLFDIAYAWLLAGDRGVRDAVDFEVLLGTESGSLDAVRADIGSLVFHTPVVRLIELDLATSHLVRRLKQNASDENLMSAAVDLQDDSDLFQREAHRFLASVKEVEAAAVSTHRVQNRLTELAVRPSLGFSNTPDTDPSSAANREWARLAIARSTYTQLGSQTVQASKVPGPASLETIIHEARSAAIEWQARGAEVRGWILHQAANALSARRGDLVSVMASEAGTSISEADTEISDAIDFAHYYAESARRLDAIDGAEFVPDTLTVVVPPWNFPVAIPAGSILAALAVGSAVIVKPAPQTRHCAAVLVEALWHAGVPRDVLRFVAVDEGPLSKQLIAHSAVDRVILTGSWQTAELFRSWRADLPLLAETTGKNAIVVTPSADVDLAVADVVASAFGHAGQKCSAARLGILVGSMADSERFRRQLVDAVSSLRVGTQSDLSATMGPLIESPLGTLAEGLTTLGEGESWLVAPQQLSADGRLWSPGIRTGVRPGSRFHTTEYFGPVLGLMHASSLEQAIEWQNGTDFGLTAGIHSLDADEVRTWIDAVDAGNLYVNRAITGSIVQRQPFGGWKRSSVGATAKTGGPNYLTRLGTWTPRPLRTPATVADLSPAVVALLDAASSLVTVDELEQLRVAAGSDHVAWTREYGLAKDVSALGVERNILRYRPATVMIRFEGFLSELVRVLMTAARTGACVEVSSPTPLPPGIAATVRIESHEDWLIRVACERPARVRLIGVEAKGLVEAIEGDPDVTVYADPVTQSGRIEALAFLLEQSVSITNHRFGSPHADPAFARLLPRTT